MCRPALPSAGLPQTKLGGYLETRVNDFLKRQNHPESGEVTIRVVHVSDKVVEVKPGMKSRYCKDGQIFLSGILAGKANVLFCLYMWAKWMNMVLNVSNPNLEL